MSSSSGTRGMMKVQVFRCIISSRDPCERALINLATARTEYSPGEAAAGVSHSFSIVTYQRGYLIQVNCSSNSSSMTFRTQAASDRDLHDWLYAINPLLAGQIKSKVRRLNACCNQQCITDGSSSAAPAGKWDAGKRKSRGGSGIRVRQEGFL